MSGEDVGREMRAYIIAHYGREPTQEEFEKMFYAWDDAVDKIYNEPEKSAPVISQTRILDQRCKHMHFAVKAKVNRLVGMEIVDVDKIDIATSRVTGHTLDLAVLCKDCGLPFRFLGLQAGLHPREPRVSIDATELRAPLEPSYVPEILGTPIMFGKA